MEKFNNMNHRQGAIFFVITFFCLFFSSCKKDTQYFKTSGRVFNTEFEIKYKFNRTLEKEIKDCFDKFNLSLNPFNKESIIYKVNNNESVEVDYWFKTVFEKAIQAAQISGGRYDITCAPFINLWGFGFKEIDSGEDLQHTIDSLKQFIGYGKIYLDGNKVIKKDPRIQLNASSIAKGYACDVIAELLESFKVTDYLVAIGGEIHAKGRNPSGFYWRIEIPRPIDDSEGKKNQGMEFLQLRDKSIATSGNYRNFRIKDGKKYGHTINALTGYPAESNILSASVIYDNCMTADAFATVFMTMDLEEAVDLGDRLQADGFDYLFIYADEKGNLKEKRSANLDNFLLR